MQTSPRRVTTSAHPAHGSEKTVAFGGWFFFVCASGRLLPAEARFGGAPIFPHQTLASFLRNPSKAKLLSRKRRELRFGVFFIFRYSSFILH